MREKWINLSVTFALISVLVLPAGAFGQLKTVRVALANMEVPDNLPYFVGLKGGFFKEAGIDLQLSYFRGGGEVVRAITTRSVDFAVTGASALLIAISKGESIKFVYGSGAGLAGIDWIVPFDSPIRSIKDLKGKKVGFSSPGSVTHMTIQAALSAEGLEKETQIVRVGSPGDSWTAVKAGVVDAGWHVSPAVYFLIVKKEARILFKGDTYVKHYQQSVVATMEDTPKKEPDMVRSFIKALAKSVKFIHENPDKTALIWADELKLPTDVVQMGFKDIPLEHYEMGPPKTENLMGSMKEAIWSGAMKEPLDLNKILDLRFLP